MEMDSEDLLTYSGGYVDTSARASALSTAAHPLVCGAEIQQSICGAELNPSTSSKLIH